MQTNQTNPVTQTPRPGAACLLVLEKVLDLCRANSLWPAEINLGCRAIGLKENAEGAFGSAQFNARQCDLMIVAGSVSNKMAPRIKTLYDQMAPPKYVLAYGDCAAGSGPFSYAGAYSTLEDVGNIVPVDVYVPGCPPSTETLLEGLLQLKTRIKEGRPQSAIRVPAATAIATTKSPAYKNAVERNMIRDAAPS